MSLSSLPVQAWYVYRGADNQIILTGTVDASGWTLVFEVGSSQEGTPLHSYTPVVSGAGLVITVTLDATNSALMTSPQYFGTLWRTDSNSKKPLAVGIISVLEVLQP